MKKGKFTFILLIKCKNCLTMNRAYYAKNCLISESIIKWRKHNKVTFTTCSMRPAMREKLPTPALGNCIIGLYLGNLKESSNDSDDNDQIEDLQFESLPSKITNAT